MFSSLSSLSLPTILTSTRPRRLITYTTATLGTAYLAGKWALGRVLEGAERGRREGWGREDLARRFNLNIQDSQFTVLALLPTLAAEVGGEMDVEGLTGKLGERARREREERERVREEERRRREEEEERARAMAAEEEAEKKEVQPDDDAATEPTAPAPAEPTPNGLNGQPLHSPLLPMLNHNPSSTSSSSAGPSLNPSAPVFQPRETVEVEASTVSLPPQQQEGREMGASWAEVVKRDVPPASEEEGEGKREEALENGEANGDVREGEKGYEVDGAVQAAGATGEKEKKVEVNGVKEDAASEMQEPAQETKEEEKPAVPEKTKAELWNSIKLLSFTRLFTSIYLLVLLSLQTHVQLALLGRSAYVESLLSSLPPRSPSPSSSARLLPESPCNPPPALDDSATQDDPLESALYAAKSLPPTASEAAEERKDLERKYLTFSWWLLHEGWKVVWRRVEQAVEEVVGPMGLKTPLVYGELGALFAQIRRRIEQDADGKLFDFSPALHPPTQDLEIQTLISGGSYTPPSSSPTHLSADPITPSLRSLLNETSDALDSPDAALVRALALDKLFSLALEKVEVAFRTPAGAEGRGARFEDVTEKQARLASLLPVLTRLSAAKGDAQGAVLASGVNGNEWVEALEDVRELREFAAVLYGSWDRDNLRASCVL